MYRRALSGKRSDSDASVAPKQIYDNAKVCVKCKQKGGTIFTQKGNLLIAKCGSSNPCSLNIQLERAVYKNITDEFLDIINTLNDFKKEGLIRAIGVSNETCWGVMKLNEIIKDIENLCIASIQNEYSLMCRLFDNDFNELSINENIPLLAYSPLARGLLTGKYIGNKIPEGSRLSRDDKIRKIVNENSDLAVKSYCSLASKYNIDPVHMSLAFCNERPFMGSVIFGATDITQLRKILAGINLKLDSEINDEIQILYKKFPLTF